MEFKYPTVPATVPAETEETIWAQVRQLQLEERVEAHRQRQEQWNEYERQRLAQRQLRIEAAQQVRALDFFCGLDPLHADRILTSIQRNSSQVFHLRPVFGFKGRAPPSGRYSVADGAGPPSGRYSVADGAGPPSGRYSVADGAGPPSGRYSVADGAGPPSGRYTRSDLARVLDQVSLVEDEDAEDTLLTVFEFSDGVVGATVGQTGNQTDPSEYDGDEVVVADTQLDLYLYGLTEKTRGLFKVRRPQLDGSDLERQLPGGGGSTQICEEILSYALGGLVPETEPYQVQGDSDRRKGYRELFGNPFLN